MPNPPLPETAYRLPVFIPAELQILHGELLSRLRTEAEIIPHFTTIHELLIERIVFNYILLRFKEGGYTWTDANNVEHTGTFEHERNQKEFNTFWLTMTREFLAAVKGAVDAQALQEAFSKAAADAVTEALGSIPEELRPNFNKALQDAFQERGM